MSNQTVLDVREISKYFQQTSGVIDNILGTGKTVKAVDNVSITLKENESVALIGESGCGKSTLVRTLMGLHRPTGGQIYYRGTDISTFNRSELKDFRSNVQIIFQDPYNSLDPKFTVRDTLIEPLKIHNIENKKERVREICNEVELRPPENYLDRYPNQLSGGEKQRVSIARALVVEPEVLLADEPVSMLDVSTQAEILNLLSRLIDELGISLFYISHDLSTVSYVADTINVMYLGRIVERGPTADIIRNPKHPYTRELIQAVPIPNPHANRERTSISGVPREPVDLGEGCRFADRCPDRMDICDRSPQNFEVGEDHLAACHLYNDQVPEELVGESA